MKSASLVIDLTKSFEFFSEIEFLCDCYGTYYVTATTDYENSYSKHRYYALPDSALEAEKLTNKASILGNMSKKFFQELNSVINQYTEINFDNK